MISNPEHEMGITKNDYQEGELKHG